MKILFKIIIGVLIAAMVASCFVFVFDTDLSKLKFWEKDTSTDVNDDTSNTDTNTPGDSTDTEKPGDSTDTPDDPSDPTEPPEKNQELSGSYYMLPDVDFSSLDSAYYEMKGVTLYFADGSTDVVSADSDEFNYVSFSKDGMKRNGDGGFYWIWSVESKGPADMSGYNSSFALDHITFDGVCETDQLFYGWFTTNFYKYVGEEEPEVKDLVLDGMYALKADTVYTDWLEAPIQPFNLKDVTIGFSDGSEKYYNGDMIEIIFDYTGIYSLAFGGEKEYIYDSIDSYYTPNFEYIKFNSLVVEPGDSDRSFYLWLLENFETYVAPEPEGPQDIVLDGKYQVKADADFSSIPGGSFEMRNDHHTVGIGFITMSTDMGGYTVFNSNGIRWDYYGSGGMLYTAATSSNLVCIYEYEGQPFYYIAFESLTVAVDSESYAFYTWFLENLEPYVEPTLYQIEGSYRVKDGADFSALTSDVRIEGLAATLVSGKTIKDEYYNKIYFKSTGIYYEGSGGMGSGYIYDASTGGGNVDYKDVTLDYITLSYKTYDQSFYDWFMDNFVAV